MRWRIVIKNVMLFTAFFVFIYPAAQFILLLYLIGFQKSHCEEYLKKDSRSYYHLWYQYEMLALVLSGAGAAFQSEFTEIKTRTRKPKTRNKAKHKYCNGYSHWGNPTCFSANVFKAEKISYWINLKNSKRSSESPFKTAALRNLEHLEAHERLFSLKLNYSIWTSVIFKLLPWTHSLNERTKYLNKDSPIGRLSPLLPRYGEQIIDTRTRSKIANRNFWSKIDILSKFFKTIFS